MGMNAIVVRKRAGVQQKEQCLARWIDTRDILI